MRNYQWWKKQKKRVQKKYTLLLGRYLSPKELREWYYHSKRVVLPQNRQKVRAYATIK